MCANVNQVTGDRTAPASFFFIYLQRGKIMEENESPLYGTFTNDNFCQPHFEKRSHSTLHFKN